MKPINKIILVLVLIVTAGCGATSNSKSNPPKKSSTAQANVLVMPDQLAMPGLNRTRTTRIYLPPHYAESNKRYPVIYMHDGQNLFDVATAYSDEWGVDEALNALSASHQLEVIVVGIDNGQDKRMTELNPWDNPEFGASEGKAYLDYIVTVVKPAIDQQYRTLADRENTAIMGSSMGGLISHYAVVEYPSIFSKTGIFSPSYWASPKAIDFFSTHSAAADARLYFYMGAKEGGPMLPDVNTVYSATIKAGHPTQNATLNIVEGADHNELAWSKEFARSVLWLFAPAQ